MAFNCSYIWLSYTKYWAWKNSTCMLYYFKSPVWFSSYRLDRRFYILQVWKIHYQNPPLFSFQFNIISQPSLGFRLNLICILALGNFTPQFLRIWICLCVPSYIIYKEWCVNLIIYASVCTHILRQRYSYCTTIFEMHWLMLVVSYKYTVMMMMMML